MFDKLKQWWADLDEETGQREWREKRDREETDALLLMHGFEARKADEERQGMLDDGIIKPLDRDAYLAWLKNWFNGPYFNPERVEVMERLEYDFCQIESSEFFMRKTRGWHGAGGRSFLVLPHIEMKPVITDHCHYFYYEDGQAIARGCVMATKDLIASVVRSST